MAIDVKEWAKRLYDDVPWPEQRQFIEGVVALIRAVIADEAAKQKRDQLEGILGRQTQPQQPERTGDVPEWFCNVCAVVATQARAEKVRDAD